jgi:hypothetical protein
MSRINGDMSRTNGDMSRTVGDMSRINGDMSRINGDMSRIGGDLSPRSCNVSPLMGEQITRKRFRDGLFRDRFKGAANMPRERDSVPTNDADFDNWFKNLVQTVNVKTTGADAPWTHIPASEVTLLTTAFPPWHSAYVLTLTPHTPEVTMDKDEARETAEAIIRPFVGQWLMWKQVTDAEREDMGIHNPQPRRPIIPVPSTVPVLDPQAGHARQVVIPYRDQNSPHRGKPADVHGIEVRWALLDHPPAAVADLINSSFDTASPLTLTFGEEDRGKRIYMTGRWEIQREGAKGDFGEIVSAIVP